MLIEEQIAARRERAHGSVVRILAKPDGDLYGDYAVRSASKKTYRVAMRGPGLFDNYCSCPDFAVNTLGTCKHIEALLFRLHRRRGTALDDSAAGVLHCGAHDAGGCPVLERLGSSSEMTRLTPRQIPGVSCALRCTRLVPLVVE